MKHLTFLFAVIISFSIFELTAQEEEFGLASYYSDDFQGRSTAYGDTYDKNEMTCAHKRYPYGTRVKVTRLDNNKSVIVKVIDKGPFIKGRIVDLSRRAAQQLGIIEIKSVKVKVEKLGGFKKSAIAEAAPIENKITTEADNQEQEIPETYEEVAPARNAIVKEAPISLEEKAAIAPTRSEKLEERSPAKTTQSSTKKASSRSQLVGKDFSPYGLYKFALEKPEQKGFGVQVASFSSFDNVLQRVSELQAKWFDNILISMEAGTGGKKLYKIILGPFGDQKTAQHYQASLKSRYSIKGFVVDLTGLKY